MAELFGQIHGLTGALTQGTGGTVGLASEAGTYSIQKADNSIETRIAAARSDDGWSLLLRPKPYKSIDIAAWGNGRGRGWANGGAAGPGSANARY